MISLFRLGRAGCIQSRQDRSDQPSGVCLTPSQVSAAAMVDDVADDHATISYNSIAPNQIYILRMHARARALYLLLVVHVPVNLYSITSL